MNPLTNSHFFSLTTTGRAPLQQDLQPEFRDEDLDGAPLDRPCWCETGRALAYTNAEGDLFAVRGLVWLV
jgi:hypothetical protein